MKAIGLTISQPPLPEVEELNEPVFRNQFHAQLLRQANELPVRHKFWDEKPAQVKQYEWDAIQYRR